MKRLLGIATTYSLDVHMAHLPGDDTGYFVPGENRIYLDLRLTPAELRTTLAHEIGHAHYGHDCDSARNERQADLFAVRLLIDPSEYADVARISTERYFLADELGVTVDIIDTFKAHCLTRIGNTTYAWPRLGAKQFAFAAVL